MLQRRSMRLCNSCPGKTGEMRNEVAAGVVERYALRDGATTPAGRVVIASLCVALIGAMSTLVMSWPAAADESVLLPATSRPIVHTATARVR